MIIADNDFSNTEKILISTTSTVLVQNIGEYIALENDGVDSTSGSEAGDDIGQDGYKALASALVSFAVSSYFTSGVANSRETFSSL